MGEERRAGEVAHDVAYDGVGDGLGGGGRDDVRVYRGVMEDGAQQDEDVPDRMQAGEVAVQNLQGSRYNGINRER